MLAAASALLVSRVGMVGSWAMLCRGSLLLCVHAGVGAHTVNVIMWLSM
jgi:hypothetical protein